jgi:hypothetical protein
VREEIEVSVSFRYGRHPYNGTDDRTNEGTDDSDGDGGDDGRSVDSC